MLLQLDIKKVGQSVDIAIERNGKFAAIRSNKLNKGIILPGGKLEVGENLNQAAIREAKEEVGLDLLKIEPYYSAPICLWKVGFEMIGMANFICTCYRATATGELVSSDEGDAIWATRQELMDGPFGQFYEKMFEYYDHLEPLA